MVGQIENINKNIPILQAEIDTASVKDDTEEDKTNISATTDDEKNGTKMFQKAYFKLSNDEKSYKSALKDWINFCKDFLKK